MSDKNLPVSVQSLISNPSKIVSLSPPEKLEFASALVNMSKQDFEYAVNRLERLRDMAKLAPTSEKIAGKLASQLAELIVTTKWIYTKNLPKPMTKSEAGRKGVEAKHNLAPSSVDAAKLSEKDRHLKRAFKGIDTQEELQERIEQVRFQKRKVGKSDFREEDEPIVYPSDFIKQRVHRRNNNDSTPEWYTPPDVTDKARNVMGSINLDPTSSKLAQTNVKADRYYTKEDDALLQDWQADTLWLNPPYSTPLIRALIKKLFAHLKDGSVKQAIVLTHSVTETDWGQSLMQNADVIFFMKGKVNFRNFENKIVKGNSILGQMFAGFNVDIEKFKSEFSNGTHLVLSK